MERITGTNLNRFFEFSVGGTDYPQGDAIDPRIFYDHKYGRWVACAADFYNDSGVLLAVSESDDPYGSGGSTWMDDNWYKYIVPMMPSGGKADYPTIGVDDNGVYIVAVEYNGGSKRWTAIPRASLYAGTASNPITASAYTLTSHSYAGGYVMPVINFDDVSSTGPAWLIQSQTTNPSNITDLGLYYAPVTWSGSTASLGSWTRIDTPNHGTAPPGAPKTTRQYYNWNFSHDGRDSEWVSVDVPSRPSEQKRNRGLGSGSS